MADIGSGAHTRTVDALPRDRELLAGGVGTGAGEEEDNTDAATDEEVECEGVALTTAVGAEHNEHDAAVYDELRRGTWMTKDTAVGDELHRGTWMTKEAVAGDELQRGVDGGGCGRRRRAPAWGVDDGGRGRRRQALTWRGRWRMWLPATSSSVGHGRWDIW
uniref:Uncharacterized protein n=1 Tax=Oryza sativa subsp. japonica TaxID=39947 RepID=Q6ZHE7_ORYSJ|nr:hypothetical protein [Oryza sativa Japonica Group]